jgi:CubicO group peptidase (beta-lactamase class C family)
MSLGFDSAKLARIDDHLRATYIDSGRFPHAALLIARGGEVVHHVVMGEARPGAPLKDDAIFRIASMTKPITSIAFMQLVEAGKVALADPVAKVLPEFANTGVFLSGGGDTPFATRPPASPIRMIDLLRHTAGLTYSFQERTNVDAAYRRAGFEKFSTPSMDAFVAGVAAMPLEFDPGAAWNYSVATDVLGAVIERITGQTLADYFAANIFAPLGMVDTHFQLPDDKLDRVPDCYVWQPGAARKKLYDPGATTAWARAPGYFSGGGGLVSTVADYHRFATALLKGGGGLVSRHTLKLMTANHLPGGVDLTRVSRSMFSEVDYEGVGFGLGFSTILRPMLVPGNAGEFGWGGMFSTAFFVDPVDEVVMIFMTQLMPSNAYPVRREIKTMLYAAMT